MSLGLFPPADLKDAESQSQQHTRHRHCHKIQRPIRTVGQKSVGQKTVEIEQGTRPDAECYRQKALGSEPKLNLAKLLPARNLHGRERSVQSALTHSEEDCVGEEFGPLRGRCQFTVRVGDENLFNWEQTLS